MKDWDNVSVCGYPKSPDTFLHRVMGGWFWKGGRELQL